MENRERITIVASKVENKNNNKESKPSRKKNNQQTNGSQAISSKEKKKGYFQKIHNRKDTTERDLIGLTDGAEMSVAHFLSRFDDNNRSRLVWSSLNE